MVGLVGLKGNRGMPDYPEFSFFYFGFARNPISSLFFCALSSCSQDCLDANGANGMAWCSDNGDEMCYNSLNEWYVDGRAALLVFFDLFVRQVADGQK